MILPFANKTSIIPLTPRRIVMKKHLKLFISSVLIALTFASPQVIHGMEELSTLGAQKTPSGIQLLSFFKVEFNNCQSAVHFLK
jgi:hypothetical protein